MLRGSTRHDVMEAAAGGVPLHIGEDRHQLRELLSGPRDNQKGRRRRLPDFSTIRCGARAGYVTRGGEGLMVPKRRMMWGSFCAIARQEEPRRLSIHAMGQSVD